MSFAQPQLQPARLVAFVIGADLFICFTRPQSGTTSWALARHQPLAPPSQLMSTTMTVSANDVVRGILCTSAVVFQLVHQP